jgi:hypothetical protein
VFTLFCSLSRIHNDNVNVGTLNAAVNLCVTCRSSYTYRTSLFYKESMHVLLDTCMWLTPICVQYTWTDEGEGRR